jgi:hypothetical protein
MNITWSGFDAGDGYVQTSGSYDDSSNSQTGTLTVNEEATTEDRIYTCNVTSLENSESSSKSVEVELNVFGN